MSADTARMKRIAIFEDEGSWRCLKEEGKTRPELIEVFHAA
jgi:hypothetical protein